MKAISLLLVLLLLLQSCNVYKGSASVQEAVAAETRAKVITTDDKNFIFKRLEIKDNRLTGITSRKSTTAKKLIGMGAEIDGKYLKVDLSRINIKEIKLRNEFDSALLTVVAVAASAVITYLAVFFISFATSDWAFGEGSE